MRWITVVLAAAVALLLALPSVYADGWQAKEAAIMLALQSAVGTIPGRWPEAGKRAGTSSPVGHHCRWPGVACDDAGRVTTVRVHDAGGDTVRDGNNPVSRALLAELAGLEALEQLSITANCPFTTGIPATWLQPGAFPRLKELSLQARRLATPLPDLGPGVLPTLEQLTLHFGVQAGTLPASWGRPDVLPQLRELRVTLASLPELPDGWAAGFRRLTHLNIGCIANLPPCESAAAAQAGGSLGHHLPASWASGFPLLRMLLVSTGASGTVPATWEAGFASLTRLDLSRNRLTGPLPPELFGNQNQLRVVYLSDNCFTGALPDTYASAQVEALILSSNNLSGEAFPAAWLEPGALPRLNKLDLSLNRGLTGSLPANLSWPRLEILNLYETNVHGDIPPEWCQSPFASSFERLFVTNPDDNRLPPCAANAMSKLVVVTAIYRPTSAPPYAHYISTHAGGGAGRGGLQVAAISLCLLVAAVAMAALGRAHLRGLWQQVIPREADAAQQGEGKQLLDSLEAAGRPSSSSELSERAALCRQRRLAALLSSKSVPHSRTAVEMVPLHALPGALTHRLVERAAAASSLGGSGKNSCTTLQHAGQWQLDTVSLQLQPEELEFVTDGHGRLVVLGEGAHAVVYHGRLQGCDVAVKVYEVAGGIDAGLVWNEAAMLRNCTHPRIMPLYGISVEDGLIMLAMKHMEGGCLRDVLRHPDAHETLSWHNWGRQLALDVAEGLAFLHTHLNCLHADLKASNVLLDEEGRACLADLALAKILASCPARTAAGATYTYAAPEQLMGQRCTLAADMFSLGVLLIEITTRTLSTKRGGWRLPRAPNECPQAVVDLIMECISLDPLRRPTAGQALQRLQAADADASAV